LPPGFDSASDTGKANGNGQGLGLGKIPPGLAKLFGYDDGTGDNKDFVGPEGLPPGFEAAIDSASDTGKANGQGLGVGNIPPGQAKKLDIGYYGEYTADDTFEFSAEGLIEDSFEGNYDKMFKGSKEKQTKDLADKLRGAANAKGNQGGGNPNCNNEGVTDNDPTNNEGAVNQLYTIDDFTAVGSSCNVVAPESIIIQVSGPAPPPISNLRNGDTFTPDESGTWTITASAEGQFLSRTVNVIAAGGIVADAGPDQNPVTENDLVILDGTGSSDVLPGIIVTYFWEYLGVPANAITLNSTSTAAVEFTAPNPNPDGKEYEFRLTVTDDESNTDSDKVIITIFQ